MSDRIVESGGIKLLIKVMKKGSLSARALAAGVLGKLAIDIDLLVKMASIGGIPPLVRSAALDFWLTSWQVLCLLCSQE